MNKTGKILKIFTCLNFSLIFALTSTISSEAMKPPPEGGKIGSSFGSDSNKGSKRLIGTRRSCEEDYTDAQLANFPSYKYFRQKPNQFQFDQRAIPVPKHFQLNPDQINSNESIQIIIPISDYILSQLHFVIPSREDLLKFIPNISMKGIMGQLLDQYGGNFPAHEMTLSCLTQSDWQHSPIHVQDYNNPTKYETSTVEMKGQYINVQFTRILVKPLAYAIRSDFTSVHTNHLKTFVLKGKLPNGDWEIIDERVNIYQLARPTTICVFFVNPQHFYQEIRLEQTGPSHAGFYKFAIAGFDIHGEVKSSAPCLSEASVGEFSGQ